MNTLKEASLLKDPNDITNIVNDYFFAMVSSAPITTQSLTTSNILRLNENNIEMKLERIFVDSFREKITSDLKTKFTSTNKKVQKRKIKKIKQREQQLEKEREEKRIKEEQDQKQEIITVQNKMAVQMLIGGHNSSQDTINEAHVSEAKPDQEQLNEFKVKAENASLTQQEKKKTKRNKKKKGNAKKEESQTAKEEEKAST